MKASTVRFWEQRLWNLPLIVVGAFLGNTAAGGVTAGDMWRALGIFAASTVLMIAGGISVLLWEYAHELEARENG